jgi:muramoyltetrapeptide carboxypeptidase LdcA involved in peptidoglycan recycling/CubicO group peptidase (beta-lactamase class C family)
VRPEQFEMGLAKLRDRGFRVTYDPTLGTDGRYLAADDSSRARDFRSACEHPDVKAILAARGGFGCMRILDRLSQFDLPSDRWLVGYSDVTALHLWAAQRQRPTLHGPMVCGIGRRDDSQALDHLIEATAGRQPEFERLEVIRPGIARGPLVGGNLSLVLSLLDTPYLPSLEGKLLFIEEVGEPLYRLDRMLTELVLRTRSAEPLGVIAGQFTRCGGNLHQSHVDELVRERLAKFSCPSAVGLPVGHEDATYSLVLNVDYDFEHGSLRRVVDDTRASKGSQQTVDTQAAPHDDLRVEVPAEWKQSYPREAFLRPYSSPGRTLALIDEALRAGVCSAIQLEVSVAGERLIGLGAGRTGVTSDVVAQQVDRSTVFDIASLTKALSTAVLAWQLIEAGVVDLDAVIPASAGDSEARLEDLLRHSSGLPGYRRLYHQLRKDEAGPLETREAFRSLNRSQPVGTSDYSDPGYIQLGFWLEELLGEPLDTAFVERVAKPLGLLETAYRRVSERGEGRPSKVAATEYCGYRGETLQGIVHDEHAQLLDGVAGHAGLFGTADEVTTIAESLLGYGPSVLEPSTVERMWSREARVGSFVRGWDTPSGPRSNAGSRMTPVETVGHLGFTGTSVWIEREREVVITLLTNRVHPTRTHEAIRSLRPAIHDAVMSDFVD